MAIYDTMQYIKSPISTVCMGQSASMQHCFWRRGKEKALCTASFENFNPSTIGGFQGQATDIDIQAKEILRLKDELNRILADLTGQPLPKIINDTERRLFYDQ